MLEKTDKLVVNATGKLADVKMPDPTKEEIAELDGKEVKDQDGNEYVLRHKVNKDLGNGDVVKNIEAEQKSTADSIYLGKGAEVNGKWDDNMYLEALYDEYFSLVQKSDLLLADMMAGRYKGKIYDEFSCFEDFCKDCLVHLSDQLTLFKSKLSLGSIDIRQYQNSKTVIEVCSEVLTKFLAGDIKF